MADKIATRASYGRFLREYGADHGNVVVLDADLSGSTQTKEFAKIYKDRFFNVGIAECDMLGMAAGFSACGKTVFASSFAMFAAGRAYEIIRNSIAYTKANVKICATHAGLTVGEDGASHQAIEDIALMNVIPGMTVVCPADDVSARKLLLQVAEFEGPAYVRLGRAAVPVVYGEDADVRLGKALTVREGSDVTIIACGIMVEKAMLAAEILQEKGISARILDMHTIKPLDEEAVIKAAKETGGIITAEEHSVIGGLGSAVASCCAKSAPCRIEFVGVQDRFGESGKPAELLEKYGLTEKEIVQAAEKLVK